MEDDGYDDPSEESMSGGVEPPELMRGQMSLGSTRRVYESFAVSEGSVELEAGHRPSSATTMRPLTANAMAAALAAKLTVSVIL